MDEQMIAALRGQSSLGKQAKRLRGQQEMYQNAMPNPQFVVGAAPTQTNIGGSSFQTPGATQIDYGAILGKGTTNFLAARAGKKAEEKEDQLEQISQQFMDSTLKDDPQAAKLYGLVQAGMPGAGKALSEHLAPKKEALGSLTQLYQSGLADPDLIRELAPRYGLDPEVAASAALYASNKKQELEQQKHDMKRQDMDYQFEQRKMLKGIPQATSGRGRAGTEVQTAGGGLYEIDGVPASPYKMTAGERQNRAKELNSTADILQKADTQIAKFPDVWNELQKPSTFGTKQKLAEMAATSDIPILSGIGTSLRNKGAVLLEDYINSETLARMAQLGGNDSNEELRRMQASLPKVINNPEAARALAIRLDAWTKRTRAAIGAKRQDVQSGKYYDPRSSGELDYYRSQEPIPLSNDYQPQDSGSAPISGDITPSKKSIENASKKRKSFDDIFNEVNK